MKINEHAKAVRHEQQVQESIEARESLFEAAEAAPYSSAVEQYQSAIEIYPYDERGYIQLANLKIEKEEFQEAYDILQKGMEFCPNSDGIKQLSEQTKVQVDYAQKIKEGDDLNAAANYEKAIKKYQEALQIDATQEQAYAGIVQCYLIQNNIEEAQNFLQTDSVKNLPDKSIKRLRSSCYMQNIYNLLSQEDYMAIREYMVNNQEDFLYGFYQKGKFDSNWNDFDLTSPILKVASPSNSPYVYYGNLASTGSRDGNGKTVWFSFSTAEDYYYADGEWNGTTLSSGNAFKQELITTSDGNDWIFTYSGSIENDMFHGDINFTWQKPDGSQYDSAVIHAEHGTLDCLWQEGDSYVYAQSSSGLYWRKNSMDGLKGYSYKIR